MWRRWWSMVGLLLVGDFASSDRGSSRDGDITVVKGKHGGRRPRLCSQGIVTGLAGLESQVMGYSRRFHLCSQGIVTKW